MGTLNYYLPRHAGIRANIEKIDRPLKDADLPSKVGLYWLFGDPVMAGNAAILCHYRVKSGNVLVLGRSRAALPELMKDRPNG